MFGANLFRKNIEPHCAYCEKGSPINENEVVCTKRGVVDMASSCRSFVYDPLKRVPPRPAGLDTAHLEKEDFSI